MVRGGFCFPVLFAGLLAFAGLAGCASQKIVEAPNPGPPIVPFVVQADATDLADGQVLRVNRDEVYINLGRKDRVRVGMIFAAYDPRLGVKPTSPGNGSLEIIEVADDYAICRVQQTAKNRAIGPRNLIYSSVYHYDKNRALHFAVSGALISTVTAWPPPPNASNWKS